MTDLERTSCERYSMLTSETERLLLRLPPIRQAPNGFGRNVFKTHRASNSGNVTVTRYS